MSDRRQEGQLVSRFAAWMLVKLRQNAHKVHWSKQSNEELLELLKGEVAELEAALANEGYAAVRLECADVANIAAMIADNVGMGIARPGDDPFAYPGGIEKMHADLLSARAEAARWAQRNRTLEARSANACAMLGGKPPFTASLVDSEELSALVERVRVPSDRGGLSNEDAAASIDQYAIVRFAKLSEEREESLFRRISELSAELASLKAKAPNAESAHG